MVAGPQGTTTNFDAAFDGGLGSLDVDSLAKSAGSALDAFGVDGASDIAGGVGTVGRLAQGVGGVIGGDLSPLGQHSATPSTMTRASSASGRRTGQTDALGGAGADVGSHVNDAVDRGLGDDGFDSGYAVDVAQQAYDPPAFEQPACEAPPTEFEQEVRGHRRDGRHHGQLLRQDCGTRHDDNRHHHHPRHRPCGLSERRTSPGIPPFTFPVPEGWVVEPSLDTLAVARIPVADDGFWASIIVTANRVPSGLKLRRTVETTYLQFLVATPTPSSPARVSLPTTTARPTYTCGRGHLETTDAPCRNSTRTSSRRSRATTASASCSSSLRVGADREPGHLWQGGRRRPRRIPVHANAQPSSGLRIR